MGPAHLSALGAIGLQRPRQSVRREQGAADRTGRVRIESVARPHLESSAGGLFTGLSLIDLFSCLPTLLQQAPGMSAPRERR
ncbi:hypothetical protein [Streptomyces sp. Ncost-T10-10d]|uniref:hypothetical protein n=1 Tax=Streptomyces sp. Ncost-T10-10d TaxID=1839774 RepID=UPI00081E4339|nr:hypothetical protein [Streptomyces sp. Ncost-T10-10d]SCF97414.1 hypothetical protein GA0115254_1284136 [Streptomyces sp. Ncost-T10-10d]